MSNQPSLLSVFAHPDDETFRPGGTLALLSQRGINVYVLTLTRGEAGSCGEPALCKPGELPTIREQELRCACAALGIELLRVMDYQDGHLIEVDPEQVISEILAIAHQICPKVVLSFGPDGLSGHPDHILVGQWASEAFHRGEGTAALYTVAVPQSLATQLMMKQVHPVPDETIALSVDVSPVWETKLAAMRCHATQWSSSPMINAPEERRRLFFGREYFVRTEVRDINADFLPVILEDYLL